ncbi:MAG: hypothetical protein AAF726_07365 [Planctomycetota bacterium]
MSGEGTDDEHGAVEGAEPLSYRERYAEVDVDRGPLVGALIGVGMFVAFQGMIVGAFQTGVISGETPLFAPLVFSGITQLMYVFPTALFFVNRRCPEMLKGFIAVASLVLLGTLVALVF